MYEHRNRAGCRRYQPQVRSAAQQAKDAGSAAVAITAIAAGVTRLVILLEFTFEFAARCF